MLPSKRVHAGLSITASELRSYQDGLLYCRCETQNSSIAGIAPAFGENAFIGLRPFGKALTESLNNARIEPDGSAMWEEEDYCSPPLAQERAAVLDTYFDEVTVEKVDAGQGWARIENLLKLNEDA